MGNSDLYNPVIKPHGIQFMKSFLRFFLEFSAQSSAAPMPIPATIEANELLVALEDPSASESFIIDQYRTVVRQIVQSNLSETMLLVPLVVSVESIS